MLSGCHISGTASDSDEKLFCDFFLGLLRLDILITNRKNGLGVTNQQLLYISHTLLVHCSSTVQVALNFNASFSCTVVLRMGIKGREGIVFGFYIEKPVIGNSAPNEERKIPVPMQQVCK